MKLREVDISVLMKIGLKNLFSSFPSSKLLKEYKGGKKGRKKAVSRKSSEGGGALRRNQRACSNDYSVSGKTVKDEDRQSWQTLESIRGEIRRRNTGMRFRAGDQTSFRLSHSWA